MTQTAVAPVPVTAGGYRSPVHRGRRLIFKRVKVKRKTENEVVRKICISLPHDAVQFLESRGGTRSGTIAKMIAASAGFKAWLKERVR